MAPASADFVGTSPLLLEDMEQMVVLVIWGGDNDYWSGTAVGASGAAYTVTRYEYGPQSKKALDSYREHQSIVVGCVGENTGHSWIRSLNSFIWRFFEAHPKGVELSPYSDGLPDDAPDICFVP